jgi:acetyltransferase-like isoleucine patch superfamily enzyme
MESKLEEQLIALQKKLRAETSEKYNRVNPLAEDLTDWKERGEFLFGKGKNITVYNTCTVVGDVKVGENTWIGPYTALDGVGGLTIGENCSISAGVNIVSHDTVRWALSGGKADYEYGEISIGDCCFIGTGAFITKGVTIGDHCLIGAGAVVTKNIPDNSIAVGVPAKVIGKVIVDGENVSFDYLK